MKQVFLEHQLLSPGAAAFFVEDGSQEGSARECYS